MNLVSVLLIVFCQWVFENTTMGHQNIQSMSAVNGIANMSIDGLLDESPWLESDRATIIVDSDWHIAISYFQDDEHIYVAFENTRKSKSEELYPEVLIDAVNGKSISWDKNSWWFHTSYSNCEGNGIYNNYRSCEVGEKQGWNGNNYPIKKDRSVEMVIEKSLLGVTEGDIIGIAFDVTDTSEKWYYFPEHASLQNPSTWLSIRL